MPSNMDALEEYGHVSTLIESAGYDAEDWLALSEERREKIVEVINHMSPKEVIREVTGVVMGDKSFGVNLMCLYDALNKVKEEQSLALQSAGYSAEGWKEDE